jgi:nitroreductase
MMEQPFKEIIHYATLTPSGHNTQPWKFAIKDNSILIFP